MKTYQVLIAVQFLIWSGVHGALDIAVEEPLSVMLSNAASGDPSAQFNLALAYQEGHNVPKDPARALEWYRKAGASGFGAAQYNLGLMLINGAGVPHDDKEAARWLFAAAQNGMFEAQKAMVKMYSAGRGVEKSPARALAWDIIARRTLELRFGLPAGLPPKPGALRSDGAAEVIRNGKKEWILADGSRETDDAAGVRHIEHKDGRKTTVLPDGSWETVYPSGHREQVTAQGRKTLRDPQGQLEIMETDGTRILEGDGTTRSGAKVRIRDTFGPDGKKICHSVIQGESTYEERADGTKVVETRVKRDDGVDLILTEQVHADGTQGDGRLRRADNGVGPKDTDIWKIQRTLHVGGGEIVLVMEQYSETGLFFQHELKRTAEARPPVSNGVPATLGIPAPPMDRIQMLPPQTATIVAPPLPGPVTSTTYGSSSGYDDPTAFAPKPDIAPMLGELAQIESEARNFAGATEADYQRAQAAAAAYLTPLSVSPQKATSPPAWFREKMISQTTMHETALVPILDDRSKQVPFGPHGADIIKAAAWKHAETEHFIVHYKREAEARLTLQYVEGAYTVLTNLMNLDPQRGPAKSHVFVFPEAEWKEYLSAKDLPPQLAGFAYKTELLLGAATNRDDRAESIKTLCHEVTHALVARFYPGRKPPLWMNEGLAEYIALRTMRSKGVAVAPKAQAGGKVAGNQTRSREDIQAALIGKPDANIDVERLFTRVRYGRATSPDRMAAFYANSQKCVQVLFEKLPVEGFSKFFNVLLSGNRPEAALAAAFGKQCDSVEAFRQLVNGS